MKKQAKVSADISKDKLVGALREVGRSLSALHGEVLTAEQRLVEARTKHAKAAKEAANIYAAAGIAPENMPFGVGEVLTASKPEIAVERSSEIKVVSKASTRQATLSTWIQNFRGDFFTAQDAAKAVGVHKDAVYAMLDAECAAGRLKKRQKPGTRLNLYFKV